MIELITTLTHTATIALLWAIAGSAVSFGVVFGYMDAHHNRIGCLGIILIGCVGILTIAFWPLVLLYAIAVALAKYIMSN